PPTSILLFFSCSRHHRDPHSFPTRRSSDLQILRSAGAPDDLAAMAVAVDAGIRAGAFAYQRRPEPPHRPAHDALAGRSPPARLRSEEHTSELQSRENLVCRLLLEKKKKNNN